MALETAVQYQVKSYQRLKKWFLIPLCLTLGNIRYVSKLNWSNLGKKVVPSPIPRCSSYWKESFCVANFFYVGIYVNDELLPLKKYEKLKKNLFLLSFELLRIHTFCVIGEILSLSVYIYIYVYTYTHTHTYIYVYIAWITSLDKRSWMDFFKAFLTELKTFQFINLLVVNVNKIGDY